MSSEIKSAPVVLREELDSLDVFSKVQLLEARNMELASRIEETDQRLRLVSDELCKAKAETAKVIVNCRRLCLELILTLSHCRLNQMRRRFSKI